ncbi:MAG: hypothetical protein PUG70_05690 [Lachnospiraceae bacterium]|nr:hypothetical protein [Lachnospiraceae bacterium]MDY5520755.1 hypothetical protein [Agathobacter sp.]
MEGFELPEVVYNILVPIVVALIGTICNVFYNKLENEHEWKQIREKPSSEKYLYYILRIVAFGFFVLIMYLFIFYAICMMINKQENMLVMNVIYIITISLVHVFLLMKVQPKEGIIVFKKSSKYQETIKKIMYKVPIVVSFLIWFPIMCDKLLIFLARAVMVFMVAYEIFIFIFLDGKSKYEYTSVSFYLAAGTVIENISVKDVRQQRQWIIATESKTNTQYRFRVKDLSHVEYINKIS